MAFINKVNKKTNENFSATVIAEGTKIKGDINSDSIYIYGSFEGDIQSNGTVTVSEKGYTKGNISAKTLVLSGLCEGHIECDVVDILNKGVLDGDVTCEHLIIEKGGFLKGVSKRKESQSIKNDIKVIESNSNKNNK